MVFQRLTHYETFRKENNMNLRALLAIGLLLVSVNAFGQEPEQQPERPPVADEKKPEMAIPP